MENYMTFIIKEQNVISAVAIIARIHLYVIFVIIRKYKNIKI